MTKTTSIVIASVSGLFLLGVSGLISGLSQYNHAKNLRLNCEAKEKSNIANFDNMYKKIVQSSSVPSEKAKQIKEILSAYVNGRGPNDAGKVATLVREAVPNIDLPEYGQLMNIITGSRDTWTRNQEELVDVVNVYNKYITDVGPIRSIVMAIGGFQQIEAKVISSDKTEEAFATEKDNDIKLFQ